MFEPCAHTLVLKTADREPVHHVVVRPVHIRTARAQVAEPGVPRIELRGSPEVGIVAHIVEFTVDAAEAAGKGRETGCVIALLVIAHISGF